MIQNFQVTPPPRPTDAEPFVTLNIREAATAAGPYTLIDSQAWSDPTPTTPEATAVETSLATLADGYYQFQWVDGDGDFTAWYGPVSPASAGGGMDFDSLVNEVYARGFDFLNDGADNSDRVKRWVNDSYQEICDLDNWPFLRATAIGTSPLTINDLRSVDSVGIGDGGAYQLTMVAHSEARASGALSSSSTGSPWGWMLDAQGRVQGVPLGTEQLTVDYYRVPPQLVAGSDTPLMPARFHYAIVDFAVARAMQDDESPEWQVARSAGEQLVSRMRLWAGSMNPDRTYIPLVGDDC